MRCKSNSYHCRVTKILYTHWCSVFTARSEPCGRVFTGAGSPHKPHLCECIPPPACWCCTGGMGCSQWPQTTQGVGGLAGLCHLWPGGWYCIPGTTQDILSGVAHYCLSHSPWGETLPSIVFLLECPPRCSLRPQFLSVLELHTVCCAVVLTPAAHCYGRNILRYQHIFKVCLHLSYLQHACLTAQ